MSIKSTVDELDSVMIEIKRNCQRNRVLRKRAKQLELDITEYLKSKDQSGLKYKGKALILESKEKRLYKNNKKKEEEVLDLLVQLGVGDPSGAYKELRRVQRGDVVEEDRLRIRKLKK